MLAKHNGGKYLADKVTAVLRGEAMLTAHGTQESRCGTAVLEEEPGSTKAKCNSHRQPAWVHRIAPGKVTSSQLWHPASGSAISASVGSERRKSRPEAAKETGL
jgi:hypothetical protein